MDIQNGVAYVEAHGTPLERARLAALLEAAPAPPQVLEEFLALQAPDGGWPLRQQQGRPSTLNNTCQALDWLAELDELGQPALERGFNFIIERQSPRGLWREEPDLAAHSPPPWMDPGATAADIYTSATCASTLALLSDEHTVEVDRAIVWLQTQVGPDGLLPGFRLHSTWLALPAFTRLVGHKSKTTRRMIVGLAQMLSPEWEGSMVAWMLNSLLDAGYHHSTQLIARAVALLDKQQRADGSWSSEEEGGETQATILAIRAARRLGVR